MKIVFLIWLHMNPYGLETRHEFQMPDMATCTESVKAARIVNNSKGDIVTLFCAYRPAGGKGQA
jgi:hypothetical protein